MNDFLRIAISRQLSAISQPKPDNKLSRFLPDS